MDVALIHAYADSDAMRRFAHGARSAEITDCRHASAGEVPARDY
jgi:hypothetical protein